MLPIEEFWNPANKIVTTHTYIIVPLCESLLVQMFFFLEIKYTYVEKNILYITINSPVWLLAVALNGSQIFFPNRYSVSFLGPRAIN